MGWELSETFDMNQRHGFTKMDLNLYIKDNIKSTILWVVFGGPAIYILMMVIEWGGDMFPVYLLILTISYIIIFKYLYIKFIGPMFNKFEQLDAEKYKHLKADLECLCEDAKFPIEKIYVVDHSKRSGHSNA